MDYLARGRSDEDRMGYIKPFVDALLPDEDKPGFDEDAARRRSVLEMVIARVNGLGEGNEKGEGSNGIIERNVMQIHEFYGL